MNIKFLLKQIEKEREKEIKKRKKGKGTNKKHTQH